MLFKWKYGTANYQGVGTSATRHGEGWEWSRVLGLDGIETLNARSYPYLYVCAIALVKSSQGRSMRNYKQTDFDTELSESRKRLSRLARTDLKALLDGRV